MGTRPIPSG